MEHSTKEIPKRSGKLAKLAARFVKTVFKKQFFILNASKETKKLWSIPKDFFIKHLKSVVYIVNTVFRQKGDRKYTLLSLIEC